MLVPYKYIDYKIGIHCIQHYSKTNNIVIEFINNDDTPISYPKKMISDRRR